ncbi:polymorphic toxin type 17 domain-containing protein [Streptomyces sp. E5N298]|uniref:polymorphic toxin type 17 domain-containing protein n=1 Tax=Streptomyces sp. E5N298 TaxID=1851983 RepID=UPI00187D62A1|nr:polymorphic toxin type 17 domain-containing protein [Streptomyces sp. E5N298]
MTLKERRAQVADLRRPKEPGASISLPGNRTLSSDAAAPDAKGVKQDRAPAAAAALGAPTNLTVAPHKWFGFDVEWGNTKFDTPVGTESIYRALYRTTDNKLIKAWCDSDPGGSRDDSGKTLNWGISDPTILTQGVEYYLKIAVSADRGTYSDPNGKGCATDWSAEAKGPSIAAQGRPVTVPVAELYGCGCLDTTGRLPFQGYIGDPVNTATGAQAEAAVDAQLSAPGVPFALRRTYSSNNTASGVLGKGWSLAYDVRLQISDTKVIYLADSGARITFAKDTSSGAYTASSLGVTATLTGSATSGFTLTSGTREKLAFNGTGRLTGWRDASGVGLTFAYSGTDLTSVTDAAGRVAKLTVDPASHLLEAVDLPGGQSVDYGYTGGLLTSVKGTDGGTTVYAYDADDRLARVTDPAGRTTMEAQYDSSGRVTEHTDAAGKKATFSRETLETDYQDPAGGIWTDVYHGSVLRNRIDPLGNITSYQYDAKLRLTAVTDPAGRRTTLTYDSAGNLLSRTSAGVTESWTYDSARSVSTHTDGRGNKTTYNYDTSRRLASIVGPAGKTSFTYNTLGQVATSTSPGGKVTSLGYDDNGNLTSRTTPSGAKTTYTYDAAGRLLTTTDPRGNASGADPAKYTTTNVYDAAGRLAKTTDPAGNTTAYAYDANGNQTKVTDAADGVTTYGYDKFNRLTLVTAPDGSVETTGYDANGNVTVETDAAGGKTTYGYDKAGRLASVTSPNGNASGADQAKYTTTYAYDRAGNLTKTVDPTGAVTTTAYDALNRPTKVTDPLGRATTTAYDGNGNVTQITDPLGKATKYTYTAADLPATVTDPLGRTTDYGYDADGNRTSVTTPLGHKTTYAYDEDDHQVRMVTARGNTSGATPAKYTWTTGYDAAGHPVSLTDPLGNVAKRSYDALGNVTSVTDPAQRTTAYGYDALGRLTSVTAPDSGKTAYGYDKAGNRTRRTDPTGQDTTYGYDPAQRLTSVTDPLERTTSYAYDADGNLTTKTTPRGTTTQNWDARGLLTKVDYSDTTRDVTYQYDAAGQMTLRDNGVRTEDFVYDDAGRLTKTRGFAYTYDAAGQILTRKYGDGTTIGYTYDADGRAITMAADSTTTKYTYDAEANLTRTTLPNTLIEDRTYDAAARLTAVNATKAGAVVTKTALSLSSAGQPTRIDTTRAGVPAGGYNLTYDKAGRITSGCAPQPQVSGCAASRTTSYTYDKAGNRLTSTLGTTATSYTYDAAHQLTSSTTGSTTTNYEYDGEGNQTKAGADTYTYDLAGQISGATLDGIRHVYKHDSEGNLVLTQWMGRNKGTEWDINAPLPLLATEYNTFAVAQSYRYDPLGQVSATETGSQTGDGDLFFYTHDALGSPLDVTGSTGTVHQRAAYDPFGNRELDTQATGDPETTPSYTGAYQDPTTGYLDLRARQYDTTTGRFTRPDPYTPDLETPFTQPYAYVENMPTSRVDPSGMCSVTTQMKDLFTGNWGFNNNCAKEDRETATLPPAAQSAKALSDKVTEKAIEVTGQTSLGLIDGLTFGTFSPLSGADVICPPAYNAGMYAMVVPFPISGGSKRLGAEAVELGVKTTVTRGMKSLIKKAKLPTRGGVRYVPPSTASVGGGLPKTSKGGYIDKFGNVWERGPSRTAGEAFEWDVQLSKHGRSQYSWLKPAGGKPLNHLNVSLNGIITHVS